MIETLDREIEKRLCALIISILPTGSGISCVPDLLGTDYPDATLPRIAIKAESQETPDLFTVRVHNVNIEARSIVAGTDSGAGGRLSQMDAAIDEIFDACNLSGMISNAAIQAYGAVPGGRAQERDSNRLINVRSLMVPARLR